jgi:hypothetical protein
MDYGIDLDCGEEGLSPTFELTAGRVALAQAIAHRLQTPRGGLLDDPNFGIDVRSWLNDSGSPVRVFALRQALLAEVLKDERVQSAQARVTFAPSGQTLTLQLSITPVDSDTPFALTLEVTRLTVELLDVAAS